jgi:hypothetical protein
VSALAFTFLKRYQPELEMRAGMLRRKLETGVRGAAGKVGLSAFQSCDAQEVERVRIMALGRNRGEHFDSLIGLAFVQEISCDPQEFSDSTHF